MFTRVGLVKMAKKNVIFVLGAPGSGKGTQCQKLTSMFNFKHLSAGQLLRKEMADPTSKHGALIKHCMENGKIVPVEISCGLLRKEIELSPENSFLIDGFPRNQDNIDGWNKQLSDQVDLKCVLILECPFDVCIKRCLKRGKNDAANCRPDDNKQSLKKRIESHISDTKAILEFYNKSKIIRKVDGSKDADIVFADVKKIVEENFK